MTPRKRFGDSLADEFLNEAGSLLEESGSCIDSLDDQGDDPNPGAVNALFRSVHSLKGVAAMVGFEGIADAAHALEALLDDLRMGRIAPSPAARAAVRDGLSAIGSLVSRVAGGEESPALDEPLHLRLARAVDAARSEGPAAAPALPGDIDGYLSDYERHRVGESAKRGRELVLVELDLDFDAFDATLRAAMAEAAAAGELIGTFPGTASDPSRMAFRLLVALPPGTDPAALGERCGARRVEVLVEAAATPAPAPPPVAPEPAPESQAQAAPGVVRVPLEKVAALVDLDLIASGTDGLNDAILAGRRDDEEEIRHAPSMARLAALRKLSRWKARIVVEHFSGVLLTVSSARVKVQKAVCPNGFLNPDRRSAVSRLIGATNHAASST